jgi:MYXO-CTERM domain-containing protein
MIRKQTLTAFALAVSVSAIAVSPAVAAFDPTFDAGDLILGVQSSAATASVLELNIGAPLLYKQATGSILIGNIDSQLTTLFGAGWYDSPNMFFGISGASNNGSLSAGSANPNGDFNSTIYASRSRLGNGTVGQANSTAWSMSAGTVTTAATPMVQQAGTFSTNQSGGVAIIPTSLSNEWSDFNPVSGTAQSPAYNSVFTTGIQYRLDAGTFDGGTFGGLSNVEAVVDLWRVARFSNGGSTPGQGSFIGSFAITQSGDVHFVAVPEAGSGLLVGLVSLAGLFVRRRQEISTLTA